MNESKSKQEWLDRAKLFNDVADKVQAEVKSWRGIRIAQPRTDANSRE
jgi:hypothetical protein